MFGLSDKTLVDYVIASGMLLRHKLRTRLIISLELSFFRQISPVTLQLAPCLWSTRQLRCTFICQRGVLESPQEEQEAHSRLEEADREGFQNHSNAEIFFR